MDLQTCELGKRSPCLVTAESHQRRAGSCVLLGRVAACRAGPGAARPAILAPDHPACPGPNIPTT